MLLSIHSSYCLSQLIDSPHGTHCTDIQVHSSLSFRTFTGRTLLLEGSSMCISRGCTSDTAPLCDWVRPTSPIIGTKLHPCSITGPNVLSIVDIDLLPSLLNLPRGPSECYTYMPRCSPSLTMLSVGWTPHRRQTRPRQRKDSEGKSHRRARHADPRRRTEGLESRLHDCLYQEIRADCHPAHRSAGRRTQSALPISRLEDCECRYCLLGELLLVSAARTLGIECSG